VNLVVEESPLMEELVEEQLDLIVLGSFDFYETTLDPNRSFEMRLQEL
jgi:hypothetical protein